MSEQDQPSPATPTSTTQPTSIARDISKAAKRHLIPKFLEAYKKCESQIEACRAVGIDTTTIGRWKRDPKFQEMFTKAHLEAVEHNNDGLKRTALSLGISGNPHFAIDKKTGKPMKDEQGKPIVLYREFYPQLQQFLLKNRLPDEFKDKFEHEVTGQIVTQLSSEFLAIIRRIVPPTLMPAIQKELETLSAKMTST